MEIDDLVKMLLESEINIDGKVYQTTSVDVKREPTGDADIEIKLCKVFKVQKNTTTGANAKIGESHINEALKLNNLG